ncbi:MAG TPA: MFS transporter [Opitutaceae bacterium]|nr:MFS transporter [Opitutaceae bacterium]
MSGDKLRLTEKISYGFGDFASCLYWQTFMVYLTFFYTDVFGITAAATAAMLGTSRSLDAFFDPVIGMIADRTQTRWGKFRPYLIWFCVPMAIAGVLTFTTPNFGESGKLLWAIVTYNALMLIYTAINIPYTAMLGVISPNPNERTTLSSIKFICAYAAGMVISATLLPLSKTLGAGNEQRGWQFAFVIVGLVVIACFLVVFFNTKERVLPSKTQKTSVLRDLGDLVTNGPWLILLATTITFILFVAVRSSVTTHYFKYFVGTQEVSIPFFGGMKSYSFDWLVSAFNTSGQLASLAGVFVVPFFAKAVGRKVAFISLFLVAVVATASFYFIGPKQVWLLLGLNLIGSATGGPLSALIWAMYADTADYGEWKSGRRATGLIFSASIFSQKEGWAIGAAVGLGLMSLVGFKANVEQNADTLHGLRLLMSLIPAAFGIISILLVGFYPLNEKKVAQIGEDLKARRIAAGEEPAAS